MIVWSDRAEIVAVFGEVPYCAAGTTNVSATVLLVSMLCFFALIDHRPRLVTVVVLVLICILAELAGVSLAQGCYVFVIWNRSHCAGDVTCIDPSGVDLRVSGFQFWRDFKRGLVCLDV